MTDGEGGSAEYDDPSISALLLKNLKLISTNYAGIDTPFLYCIHILLICFNQLCKDKRKKISILWFLIWILVKKQVFTHWFIYSNALYVLTHFL